MIKINTKSLDTQIKKISITLEKIDKIDEIIQSDTDYIEDIKPKIGNNEAAKQRILTEIASEENEIKRFDNIIMEAESDLLSQNELIEINNKESKMIMNPVEEPHTNACKLIAELQQSDLKSFKEQSAITETMKKVV